jgi:hypothetical protein
MAEINYGISAGSVEAKNIVTGPNGTIIDSGVPPALQQQLDQLRTALVGFQGDPEARARIAAATDEVAAELDAPRPNKSKLLQRLAAIAQAAGSASAVTTAATGLIGLVNQLV